MDGRIDVFFTLTCCPSKKIKHLVHDDLNDQIRIVEKAPVWFGIILNTAFCPLPGTYWNVLKLL